MLSSVMRSSCSVSRCAPSEGNVVIRKSQFASSMLLSSRSQSASLKCHTSRSCDAVSGILNFTCVRTPLWSATAAQGFAEQSGTSVSTKSRMYFPRVGSFTSWRSPIWFEVSHSRRPSALSRAECVSQRMLCTFKSPSTNTPTAPSLCVRCSASKLMMVSTFPGFGGRYQQHIRYGPRSVCAKTHTRSATSEISTSVTRGAYSSNMNTKTPPPHWPSRSRRTRT